MRGARSSHWPLKAFAPPMPAGPTISGPLPDPISVASAAFAPAYGTASKVRWMFACDLLKSSTTFFSTAVCSGASPPPMQQNQRISIGPPGGTVAGPDEGGAVATAAADALGTTAGAELAGDDGPHAAKTRATAAMSEPTLDSLVRMVLLSMIRP